MNIFWFRRDLRLHDNAALYHALKKGTDVQCIFIFDKNILDKLSDKADPRVTFIHNEIRSLNKRLHELGSSLEVFYGDPLEIWKSLAQNKNLQSVYANEDYESYALERDKAVTEILSKAEKEIRLYKDHVIFDRSEILKDDGTPYVVFTPYKKKWLKKLDHKNTSYFLKSYPCESYYSSFIKSNDQKDVIALKEMGFESSSLELPSTQVAQSIIKNYDRDRDFPAINGTSKLGIHFRFGTISIREKARKAMLLNEVYLSELVWRDFYSQILAHFPHVEKNAFRAKYEKVLWRNNEEEFEFWKKGETGYPMVDAGMRELNNTGFMHNRVRMVVASFLTKHLLIDWRWGEAYFAEKLLDFDLASNNGGWQWAAGCGTDAAPYFRIFNPTSQLKRFDPKYVYIKKWIPEFGTDAYVDPIVDHKMARERCLDTYKRALANV